MEECPTPKPGGWWGGDARREAKILKHRFMMLPVHSPLLSRRNAKVESGQLQHKSCRRCLLSRHHSDCACSSQCCGSVGAS